MAKTMQETLDQLEGHQPDLVIVDHDDSTINRDEFLNRFVTGEMPMKVILVSLAAAEPVQTFTGEYLCATS